MNHYASPLTMKTLTFILSLRERKKNLFPLPLGSSLPIIPVAGDWAL